MDDGSGTDVEESVPSLKRARPPVVPLNVDCVTNDPHSLGPLGALVSGEGSARLKAKRRLVVPLAKVSVVYQTGPEPKIHFP